MDILHLVDRLEELFNDSRPFPLTNNVIVDEDRMLDLIDQMRVAIPEQVKQAEKLVGERDRTLAQAAEEANRTISIAREKSESLVERDSIVEAAQARGKQIIDAAIREGEQSKREADNYVLETLTNMEIEMERVLTQIRNGIRALRHVNQQDNNDPTQPE